MFRRNCFTFAFASLVFVIVLPSNVGCSGNPVATVSGSVVLDEGPLDDANITFVPQGAGQQKSGWAEIKSGRYSIPAASELGPGNYRVEIRALRTIGNVVDNGDLPVPAKELIPVRYNSKSELKAELKTGDNTVDFQLKSK
jgi:hypothetical protein